MKEKKQKGKGRIIAIVVIIIVACILITSGNKNDKPKKVNDSTGVTASKEQDVFNVGDTIELKNFKVTINNVYKVESDNQYMQPKEGNQFLAVDCTLENISKNIIIK